MKVAIIDDEYASRNELKFLISQYIQDAVFGEAFNGKDGLNLILNDKYDVAFIDINLGDMEGTVLAKLIKNKQPNIEIVFATAYEKYAVEAFDINASDYILKPFDPIRINESLKRVRSSKPVLLNSGKLTVALDKKAMVVNTEDVAYIESYSRYCILHVNGKEIRSVQTLSSFENRLDSNIFFKVHKSFLVNLNYVSEITPWINGAMSVILNGYEGVIIPVSRNKARILKDIYNI